jgi:putative ABC transport system permease protein
MFFNGHAVSMISGGQNQLAFSLFVTPSLIVVGIAWACLIGFVGGLFPAIRAARLPIAIALRDAA